MSDSNLKSLLARLQGEAPASASALDSLNSSLSHPLPEDYRRFLLLHNGGEGQFGDTLLTLWGISGLTQFNSDYEVDTYMPGVLLFANEENGDAFGFDLRPGSSGQIVRVPTIGMSWSDSTPVGNSFTHFLETLAA